MEWFLVIFCWLAFELLGGVFFELIRKAGKNQTRERQGKTLHLLEGQLKAGEVKGAVVVAENATESAEIEFNEFYFLTVRKVGGTERRGFGSIDELNQYLVGNTRFRIGDFV